MLNLFYSLLIFLVPTFGYSQDYKILDEYTSTISKMTYRNGDTIVLGVPNYSKNESYRYQNVFQAEKNWDGYDNVRENLSYKKGVISTIYANQHHQKLEFKESVVLEIEIDDHSNLFIPIDKAIASREVVVYPNPSSGIEHLPFNAETSVMLIIKSKNLSQEDAMLTYIEKLDPKKYSEWKNNEFLYQSEKQQYINEVDSVLSLINLKDTFTLVLPVELKDYDFESNSFPIAKSYTKFSETVEFPFSKDQFVFTNFTEFSHIPVQKERAEFFANSSKKSYEGTRPAFVILNVRLDNVLITQERGGMNIGSNVYEVTKFTFSIIDLSCVDSEALYYNYLGGK